MQNAPLAVATPCPPSISFPTSSQSSDCSMTPSLFVTLSHKHVTSHLHTRIFSRGILSEIRHFCHVTRALSAAGAAGRRAHVAFHPPRAARAASRASERSEQARLQGLCHTTCLFCSFLLCLALPHASVTRAVAGIVALRHGGSRCRQDAQHLAFKFNIRLAASTHFIPCSAVWLCITWSCIQAFLSGGGMEFVGGIWQGN